MASVSLQTTPELTEKDCRTLREGEKARKREPPTALWEKGAGGCQHAHELRVMERKHAILQEVPPRGNKKFGADHSRRKVLGKRQDF